MKLFILLLLTILNLHALTLKEYVNLALTKSNKSQDLNDNLINAKLNVESAKHKFDIISSPITSANFNADSDTQSLGVEATKKNIYGGESYGVISASRNSYSSGGDTYSSDITVGYRQSLFAKFGEEYNTYELTYAKEYLNLTKLSNRDEEALLIFDAVRRYYLVLLARERTKIQEEALKRAKEYYNASIAKQLVGLVSKVDVHRAKLSILNTRQALYNSDKESKNSIHEASYLINYDYDREISFETPIKKINYDMNIKINDKLLNNRADWQDILVREKLLNIELSNAKKDFLPDVTLDLKYSKMGEDRDFNAKFNEEDWQIGIFSNYSFDKFNEKTRITKLTLLKNRLKRDKEALRRSIFKEIREEVNTLINYGDSLEIQKLKEFEAEKSLEVAKIRYERGLSSNLDIIDAESEYSNAKVNYIIQLVNYNLAVLNIAKSLNILDKNFIRRVFN